MTLPATYALKVYRGDTYSWKFTLWDDADKTDPTDLTGVTPALEIRPSAGSTTLLATLECTVELPNIIWVKIDLATWTALGANKQGVWDLQLSYPDSEVVTVIGGTIAVTQDVTL